MSQCGVVVRVLDQDLGDPGSNPRSAMDPLDDFGLRTTPHC